MDIRNAEKYLKTEYLSKREREFVALGASLGSNCVPCIIYHIKEARKSGIPDEQIEEAVKTAEKIRKMPYEKVLNTAYAQLEKEPEPSDKTSGCGC